MAMLNQPRAAERDNQNSLRKFPFSDAASCTNGACTIVPGAIVDAQLYVPGREPGRVWLSSVDTNGKLRFSDEKGAFAETNAPATPDTAVPVTFTGDGGPCPGGVVVFGREADVAALRACGGQSFTAAQAELAPAAVAWPGLPGVCGFRLDDGHVVYGKVKMRGENGCTVATYEDTDGVGHLRISAVGKTVEAATATGFITCVVAESDNRHFVVDVRDVSGQVVDIQATGSELTQDDGLVADRNDLCAQVRKTLGTKPSERAAAPGDGNDCVCAAPRASWHTATLVNDGVQVAQLTLFDNADLGMLDEWNIPTRAGKNFIGYFDAEEGGRRYYRPDGTGTGKFTAGADVTLYARFVDAHSEATVGFSGYGTLHLAARSTADYANPLRISGAENPVPTVRGVSKDALEQGGADALADAILNPATPAGEIHIGLRGLRKASML